MRVVLGPWLELEGSAILAQSRKCLGDRRWGIALLAVHSPVFHLDGLG
jgi:hypothetical protein